MILYMRSGRQLAEGYILDRIFRNMNKGEGVRGLLNGTRGSGSDTNKSSIIKMPCLRTASLLQWAYY
jgi:hypothetical protein